MATKKFISNLFGSVYKNVAKTDPPVINSARTNAQEIRMYYQASSPQLMAPLVFSTGLPKSTLDMASDGSELIEKRFEHHFIEDSFCLDHDDQGHWDCK